MGELKPSRRFEVRRDPPGLGAPLRTIFCVGRNYALHAAELGNEVPTTPMIFLKPASAALYDGETLTLPAFSRRVDHEVEVVAGLGVDGRVRYAIGIDFTARDVQLEGKKKGQPWTLAKGYKGFAALGAFVDAEPPFEFWLSVNGARRQTGDTRQMVFMIDALLAYIDDTFGLAPGDVVFTGTPAGVAPLKSGDTIEAVLGEGLSRLKIPIG